MIYNTLQVNPTPFKKKPLTFIWALFFSANLLVVSANPGNDSLPKKLSRLPENAGKVDSLLKYLSKNNDTANTTIYFKEALKLATRLNYTAGIIGAYDKFGVVKRNLSNYQEALAYHKKALEFAEQTSNSKLKIQVLNNIGVVYRRLDEGKLALDFHMKALKMAEAINDVKNICISVNSIGNIYVGLNQPKKAITFFNRALPLEQKRGNLWGVSINLNNIGAAHESLNNLDSALIYYKKSLYFDEVIKKQSGIAICYNSIGKVYLKKTEYKKALEYFEKALIINKKIGDKIYISVSYTHIANLLLLKKEYKKAAEYFQKGLSIALEIGSKSQSQTAYEGLSTCYQSLGEFEHALDCYKKSVLYADSITEENNIRHITQIQSQYDSEKQLQQIELLKKEKEKSKLYVLLLTILVLAIISFSLFAYRSILQKREIAKQNLDLKEQKILQLEKEQQLMATQAVLQGEETERSRLARDLHDGLGGLLSGVKLALSNMKGNLVLPSASVELYHKALSMLDSSIKELRRVAHNMMPEALVKFGLKDALGDFCNSLDNKQIQINFQCFGIEKRFDQKIEIGLYRIAQELINNAFKHSQATELIVQLIQEENRINLTVQDNGKGFDTTILKTSKGAGVANIRSRVESLNGRFDLVSEPDKGTEVSVEFKG